MGKAIYTAVSGVGRKIGKSYAVIGGSNKKVKKIYSVVDGKARTVYAGGVPAGEQVFTSSTAWTVPDGVKKIDIFCVGGGGGAGKFYAGDYQPSSNVRYTYQYYGGGGGGGCTTTIKSVSVTPGSKITVTVGAAGTTPNWALWDNQSVSSNVTFFSGSKKAEMGGTGGTSSVVVNGTTYRAYGGVGGYTGLYNNISSPTRGGDGGSGGGVGGGQMLVIQSSTGTTRYNGFAIEKEYGTGGVDGGDGGYAYKYSSTSGSISTTSQGVCGTGQGTTTRYFGENGGTLYAYGGAAFANFHEMDQNSGSGGSCGNSGAAGVVIIRWAAQ